jgi:hypothetical protein
MAFQFLCPQGHLLEGEESQVGQQLECPQCQSRVVVPQPAPAAASEQAVIGEQAVAPPPAPGAPLPSVEAGINVEGGPSGDVSGLPGETRQSLVHISCPNGHELETPREMIGQEALCPHCKAQFRLRMEDSREHRRAEAEKRERKELQAGRAWMHWAIAIAVAVVLGLIVLFAVAAST